MLQINFAKYIDFFRPKLYNIDTTKIASADGVEYLGTQVPESWNKSE